VERKKVLVLNFQKSPLQKCLHVTATIDDQQNVDPVTQDFVNDAVGFEKNLTIFPNPQFQQFPGICVAFRGFGQTGKGFFDLLQDVIRFPWCIVPVNIVIKLVKVMYRIIGQENLTAHKRFSISFAQAFNHINGGLDLALLDLAVTESQDFQKRQGALRLLIALNVLDNNFGFTVLGDNQRLPLFAQVPHDFCGMGLKITDRLDLAG